MELLKVAKMNTVCKELQKDGSYTPKSIIIVIA